MLPPEDAPEILARMCPGKMAHMVTLHKQKLVFSSQVSQCSIFLFLELNRCQLELNELHRLVQKLHSLESGQAVNNGDLQRIISMQVCSKPDGDNH